MTDNETFYFRGTFYTEKEKFFEARKQFWLSTINPASVREMLGHLMDSIEKDIFPFGPKPHVPITNGEFKEEVIEKTLLFVLDHYRKLKKNT